MYTVPDDGLDLFSSLWDMLLTAVLLAAGSDPGAGSAFPRLTGKAGPSVADVSPGLSRQGTGSCCIIHFCWMKQNGDSGQLC